MEIEITSLQEELRKVNEQLNSILVLLKGHELDSSNGLLHRLYTMEEKLEKLDRLKDRITYVLIGCSVPAGWGIIDLTTKLLAAIR